MSRIHRDDRVIGKTQCMEFGLLLTLGMLLLALSCQDPTFVKAAIVIVLVSMLVPRVFYPFAHVWFGLAGTMGRIGPAAWLSVVFFMVVTPVGMLRRLLHKDALHRRKFKKDRDSAMITRNHTYNAGDFQQMF